MLPARFDFAALPETPRESGARRVGEARTPALPRRSTTTHRRRFERRRMDRRRTRARASAKSRVFAAGLRGVDRRARPDAPARDPRAFRRTRRRFHPRRARLRRVGVEDEGGAFGESFRGALAPAAFRRAHAQAHARAARDAAAAGTLGDAAAAIAERDAADDVDVDVDAEDADVRDEMFASAIEPRSNRRPWTATVDAHSVSSSEGASLLRRVAAAGDAAATEQLDHGAVPTAAAKWERTPKPQKPAGRFRRFTPRASRVRPARRRRRRRCFVEARTPRDARDAAPRRSSSPSRDVPRNSSPPSSTPSTDRPKPTTGPPGPGPGPVPSQSGSGSGSQSGSQSGSMRGPRVEGASKAARVAAWTTTDRALHVAARSARPRRRSTF